MNICDLHHSGATCKESLVLARYYNLANLCELREVDGWDAPAEPLAPGTDASKEVSLSELGASV